MTYSRAQSIKNTYKMVICLAIIFFLSLNVLVFYARYNHKLIIQSERNRYASIRTAYELLQNSDDLTKMARLYTITGDEKYKHYFDDIIAIRDGKLARPKNYSPFYWHHVLGGKQRHVPTEASVGFIPAINKLNFSAFETERLRKAERSENELMNLEKQAFDLMENASVQKGQFITRDKQKVTHAQQLLHGTEYLQAKSNVLEPIEEFQIAIELRTEKEFITLQARQQRVLYLFQGIILFALLLCLFAWYYASRRVVKPIGELLVQAGKVAEGDYSARNNVNTNNELETLGQTINHMCISIESDIAEREHLTHLLQVSEERFRNAIEYAPIGMAIKGLDGSLLQVNQALCEMLGYSNHDMRHLNAKRIIHPDDWAKEKDLEQDLVEGKIKSYQTELRFLHKDGHIVLVLLSAALMSDNQGKPMNFISQIHDIGPRIENEKAMAELHEQMSVALIELQNREHENTLLSKMNEMLHACQNADEAHSIIHLTAKDLFPSFSGGLAVYNKPALYLETVRQWGEQQILAASFSTKDCWALRNGNIYIVNDPTNAVLCHHYTSAPTGAYINLPLIVRTETIGLLDIHSDQSFVITDQLKQLAITFAESIKLAMANINLREALHDQAVRDSLTGIFNRRYLDETLPRELEHMKRSKSTLSLAMLDIDRFKYFNDEYGHDAGDEVLRFISKVLQMAIRGGDIACRFGGEEFVVILIETSLDEACQRIKQICQQIKQEPLIFQGMTLPKVTLSAGIAVAPMHGEHAETLLSAADDALYAAKKAGRDRVEVFQSSKKS